MKIIYGKEFLADLKRGDSFVKLTQFAIGNVYTLKDVATDPQALFDLSYIEGDRRCLGRYDFEAVWEDSNRILRMNLEIPESDKDRLSSDNYELIYIFYNDYTSSQDKIGFIMADVTWESGSCTFATINSFSGQSITEVSSPIRVGESLGSGNNYFQIKFPSRIEGRLDTVLTNNAALLEGPGVLGSNWFSLKGDETALISKDTYEMALLEARGTDSSLVFPYLDSLGMKKFEDYTYREYSDFQITTSLSPNYLYPRAILFDSNGGIVELQGTVGWTEYRVSSGIITKIGSGITDILGEVPGVSIKVQDGGTASVSVGNDGSTLIIQCNPTTSTLQLVTDLKVSLSWTSGVGGALTTVYPKNLKDGLLRVIQNEDPRWLVCYPETKFFEGSEPLYLFDYGKGNTKDIVIKTKEFTDKRDLVVEGVNEDYFSVETLSHEEYKSLISNQIDTYVGWLKTVEMRLLSSYEIRTADTEGIGRKIDGVLSGALLRTWTFTPDQYNLLLQTKNFCVAQATLLSEFSDIDGDLVGQLTEIIDYFSDKVTSRPGRSEYFKSELQTLLEGDGGDPSFTDYRGHYQYLYLLSQFDKWSYQVALQQAIYENNRQSVSRPLPGDLESELAGYLMTNLSAYLSQLYNYLILQQLAGETGSEARYNETIEAFLLGANTYSKDVWVEVPEEGVSMFYIRVKTIQENTSMSEWWPKIPGTDNPLLVTVTATNSGFTGTAKFYCVQKPKTVSLMGLSWDSIEEIASNQNTIYLGYPSMNEPTVSEEIRIGVVAEDLEDFTNLRWLSYCRDHRITLPTTTGLLGEIEVDYQAGTPILISDPIEVSTWYKSGIPERTYFSDLMFVAVPYETDPESLSLEELETDWRKNISLSRLDISLIGRGYQPVVSGITESVDLIGIGYYHVTVTSNTDINVVSTLDGLTLEQKSWDGVFTEDDPKTIDLYFRYTGANSDIMDSGSVGYKTLTSLAITPKSEDLEYWYPSGYLTRIITTRINLAASTRFTITPTSSILYVKPGEQKDIIIESPGRRVYTSGSVTGGVIVGDPETILDPLDTSSSKTAYLKHFSSINTEGSVSASGFPLSTTYRVDYWASGLAGGKLGYDVYVLPDKDFVSISSGNLTGSTIKGYYLYLPSGSSGTTSLVVTSMTGVSVGMSVTGSDFSVSNLDETSNSQTITLTTDSANEKVEDIVLGTLEITSWVDPDKIVDGKNLGTRLQGNSYLVYVMQTGLHGKLGLGNSNDLTLPTSGAMAETLLGTIYRPSSDYEVTLSTENTDLDIWIGDWEETKAPLYIKGLPAREGYNPRLVYQRDSYGWKGIYGAKDLGSIKISIGTIYTESHDLIQPGIGSGVTLGEKFYLGPSTVVIPVSTDTYTFRTGEYSTANDLIDQRGSRVYPTCPEGVTVTKNISPGEITVSLPKEAGEYPLTLGRLTLILDKVTSTYRVAGDSILEIDANGDMMSEVQIFGVLPSGMSYSQLFPSKNDAVVGYIGTDGIAQVWLSPEHGKDDLVEGEITLQIPGQSVSAGKIDYIQHTAYVGVEDEIFTFTGGGADIIKNIVMNGQVNSLVVPEISVTSGWPSFISSATLKIVETGEAGAYRLRCTFSITPETEDLSDFTIAGNITAGYITSVGSGDKFSFPYTYTFYYTE